MKVIVNGTTEEWDLPTITYATVEAMAGLEGCGPTITYTANGQDKELPRNHFTETVDGMEFDVDMTGRA